MMIEKFFIVIDCSEEQKKKKKKNLLYNIYVRQRGGSLVAHD